MRDRLAIALANWILRHLASRKTAAMIAGLIEYGMRAAAADALQQRPAPPDWRIFQTAATTVGSPSTVTYRSVP